MSAPTITDLFCGAGGSSLGAEWAGAQLVMAANHWQTAIDVHQAHFPDAGHDCADISQADPRRYPVTDILLASPECTNHSQARGVSRKRQDRTLWDAPDPAAERSRATMWDVPRFAEQNRYRAVIVENVVEATKWVMWPAWWQAMELLGYTGRVVSTNSMHHAVPQSRDRIYVVWTRNGLRVDLEMEQSAWCPRCERVGVARQAFKPGRKVGRYRAQWVWSCTACHRPVEPATRPAADIIDWTLPCPRIGDRLRPLAPATRARIIAGLARYGWLEPITTSGAGNVHERTPGNRARLDREPLPTQQTTATTALATPPEFLLNTAHGGRIHDLADPHPTVCASDDRLSLVVANNFGNIPTTTDDPLPTATTGNRHGLVVPLRSNGKAAATRDVLPTVTAGGNHHGLLMRNMTPRGDAGQMVTPTLLDPDLVVDDCGFRMLEPYEVAAAMAFPVGYIPRDLPKVQQVKLAGNAVTPPVMQWLVGRVLHALEAAS